MKKKFGAKISESIYRVAQIEPDEFFVNIIKNMPSNTKLAIVSGAIFSVLVHSFMFLNKFVNTDSIGIWNRSLPGLYMSGRWFSQYAASIRGTYSIPWVIGIFACLYLVVSIAITVSVLKIKKPTSVVIASLLMAAFPSLAYFFGFDFIADIFTLALLLSALAVYFTVKYKYGFVLGAFSLMLSLALYQAFLGFAMGMFLLMLIKHILDVDIEVRDLLKNAIRYATCGVLGLAMYMVSVRIFVMRGSGVMFDYRGMDSMGQIPLGELPGLIQNSFIQFLRFFIPMSNPFFYVSNFLFWMYFIVFLIILYYLVWIVVTRKIYLHPLRIILLVLCLFSLPVSLNIVDVIIGDFRSDTLTIYSFVLSIIFAFVLCEEHLATVLQSAKKKTFAFVRWILLCATLMIGINYVVTSGLYYFALHILYERTFAFHNRVLARIEQTEGFRADTPVALIGEGWFMLGYQDSVANFPTIKNDRGRPRPFATLRSSGVGSNRRFTTFVSHYLGVQLNHATDAQLADLKRTEEFIQMPFWPQAGSVRYIDGFIVIKINPVPTVRIEQIGDGLHYISDIGVPKDLAKNLQYAWSVFRENELVFSTRYITGMSSFEFEFSEFERYRVQIFVRTLQREFLSSGTFSDWFIYEPEK